MPWLLDPMLGRLVRGVIFCAVLGAGLLTAGRLCAQDLGPILLSYRASAGCPAVAEFQRSVERRSARVHFVDEGTHDRQLSIVLRKDGAYTTGELRLIERDGSLRQRSVRFTTCAEAVDGLALITAVSLDPQALLQEPASTKTEPPSVETSPRPSPAPKSPAPTVPAPLRALPALEQSRGPEVGVGAELTALFRALPATALGGTLFLDVASGSRSWFAPLARVALSHAERRGLPEGTSEASFALTLVTLSGCPVRLGGSALVFRPCIWASGGAVRAWGSNTSNPQTHTLQSWSWGGSGSLSLRVTEITEIIGDVSGGANLFRDRFTVDQAQFWETPAVYLSTGVGIRFGFP